jgi:hypothetical protein
MTVFAAWGAKTRESGLVGAYEGIYFPLAYQVFAVEDWIASTLGVSTFSVMKTVNLMFDAGTFALLTTVLRERGLSWRYAFYYWLHPFFLAIFWLGYVDTFMSFMTLSAVVLLGRLSGVVGAFIGGIPVALAVAFKPQALTLLVMTALLATGLLAVARRATAQVWSTLAFLLPSALAVIGYSLYFADRGYAVTQLVRYSLTTLTRASPSLTANMLNIWTPVAYHYVEPGQRLYTVTGPHVFHTVGELLVAGAFAVSAVLVCTRAQQRDLAWLVLSVVTLGALILPMLGTRAHENHLFLGLTLTVVAVAVMPRFAFLVAFNVLLIVEFVDLEARYGLGTNHLTNSRLVEETMAHYGRNAQLGASVITIAAFIVMFAFVVRALLVGAPPARVAPASAPGRRVDAAL